MADLDPFGRKPGEDPLASLGWTGSDAATQAEPVPGTPGAEPPGPTPEPARPPRETRPPRERPASQGARLRPGRAARGLLTTLIVVAVAGAATASLVGSGVDRVERVMDDFTTAPARPAPAAGLASGRAPAARDPAPAASERPAAAPRGVGRGSLLRPYAFGAAIERLRGGGYGRLTYLRVAPERIDATLLSKGGALRHVQIVPGGGLRRFGPAGRGFSGLPTMSLAGIEAGAPQRLTRSAAQRLGVAAGRVDYLVYTRFAGSAQWNAYFKGGQILSADAHGRITRRIR